MSTKDDASGLFGGGVKGHSSEHGPKKGESGEGGGKESDSSKDSTDDRAWSDDEAAETNTGNGSRKNAQNTGKSEGGGEEEEEEQGTNSTGPREK